MRALLERGALARAADSEGKTPLHEAAWLSRGSDLDIPRMLVDWDESLLRAEDRLGCTPLAYVRDPHHEAWMAMLTARQHVWWPHGAGPVRSEAEWADALYTPDPPHATGAGGASSSSSSGADSSCTGGGGRSMSEGGGRIRAIVAEILARVTPGWDADSVGVPARGAAARSFGPPGTAACSCGCVGPPRVPSFGPGGMSPATAAQAGASPADDSSSRASTPGVGGALPPPAGNPHGVGEVAVVVEDKGWTEGQGEERENGQGGGGKRRRR